MTFIYDIQVHYILWSLLSLHIISLYIFPEFVCKPFPTFHLVQLQSQVSSQTFWVVVRSLFSSLYEFFHRRLLPRLIPGKETSVTFIGLLLCFFHFQINWSRSFDDKRNFFYPIFILYISFVGTFVSVRSTHGASLKTKLIGLLPIRGVDPLR